MERTVKTLSNVALVFFSVLTIYAIYYLYQKGILTDQSKMKEFLGGYVLLAPFIFMAIQIISIIIPILPGGITSVVGVIVFGPLHGFIYNYLSIVIGSVIVFLISKRYGQRIVKILIGHKTYSKYANWLDKGKRFDKAFALAIFFPIAPDDILCYLAGLTKMSYRRYLLIIAFGKPLSILIYSLGLYNVFLKII